MMKINQCHAAWDIDSALGHVGISSEFFSFDTLVVEYRRLSVILSCNHCIADIFAAKLAFEQNVLLCLLDILYNIQCMDQIALKTPNP